MVWVVIALIGVVLVAAGVAEWSVPAGMVVSGVELVGVAYVGAYFRSRRSDTT